MHELALAQSILAVVVDLAGGERVERIRVRVGVLQRVVPDSLRFCFRLASEETCAAEAVLDVREVAARVRCRRCRAEDRVDTGTLSCRSCGAFEVEIVAGSEASVDAVKLTSGWRRRPLAARAPAEAP